MNCTKHLLEFFIAAYLLWAGTLLTQDGFDGFEDTQDWAGAAVLCVVGLGLLSFTVRDIRKDK